MTLTELEAFGLTLARLAFETVFRSVALALLCGLAVWLLRSRTASLRFLLWRWTLLALFALPVLIALTPPLSKASRVLPRIVVTLIPNTHSAVAAEHKSVISQPPSNRQANKSSIWILAVPVFYLVVTLVLLGRLWHNLKQLHKIAQRSQFIPDLNFRNLSHEIWLKSGAFLKPRLAVSEDISAPVTFEANGIWILLPQTWRRWDEAKLRAVLAHEMAHVQRGDSQNLLLASLATCIFWFHPLSWFLRRQLAVLAEEACDEMVVAGETAPEQYATFLIDFARDVKRGHGRLITGAIAVVGRSPLKRRIERLFADAAHLQHGRRVLAAIALALFVPALYVSAAANPEDLDSRMELLVYYGLHGQDKPFTTQMLWFIKHDPSAEGIMFAQIMYSPRHELSDDSRAQVARAWEEAITEHPNSPAVLYNASGFFESADSERAIALLREAETLDPAKREKYDHGIVTIYADAESQVFRPGEHINNIRMTALTALKLRQQLAASKDPALLAETGRLLAQISQAQNGDPQFQGGLELIQQAVNLDSGNPKWTEALLWAQSEPKRQSNYERLMKPGPPQPGPARIGSKVAEANLISKTDPIYPALARQARIQGTVEFTVTVGADGKVQELTLVHGHPLLANAAMEAVTKYVYQRSFLKARQFLSSRMCLCRSDWTIRRNPSSS
jgi:TonB family protein